MSSPSLNNKRGTKLLETNSFRRTVLGALVLAPVTGLLACGFRIRGMVDLPFKVVAITGSPSPPLRADLQTVILTGTNAKVAINPKDADLILEITSDQNGREILAYNSNGQISAYRLTIRVGFRAYDTSGDEIAPEAEIYSTRDLDFSNSTVLATDVQQQQFLTLMRKDLAIQIMRRVAATSKSPQARNF